MSLNLLPNCTRKIHEIRHLFGKNYALTTRNGLLLQNCSTPLNGCIIPAGLVEIKFGGCDKRKENMSCYTTQNPKGGGGILRYEDVKKAGCGVLYSSIVVDDIDNGGSDALLEFQTVQLDWWLTGTCRCHSKAVCDPIGASGFRCRCSDGFIGDGFVDGEGCRNGKFFFFLFRIKGIYIRQVIFYE